jgi:hypothetical protein
MTPDPLRIEFRKIGGMFTDGPDERLVHEVWGCFLCHNGDVQQEFVLAVGTKESMFEDGIARMEGILERLKQADQQAKQP